VKGGTQTEVSEDRLLLLKGAFETKRQKLTWEWRNMHDEELHNL
jgi:hypothetical protein